MGTIVFCSRVEVFTSIERTRRDEKMAHKNSILIALLALLLLTPLAGCGESNSRTASAQRRWQRVIEQARLEAAQQSIEEGRLLYAVRLLEDLVESDSVFAEQAKQLLDKLRTTRNSDCRRPFEHNEICVELTGASPLLKH